MPDPPSTSTPPSPAAVVARSLLGYVTAVLPVFLVGGMSNQIRADLALAASALGGAVAVFWGTAAAASTVLGAVGDRFGTRFVMLAGGAATLVGCGIVLLAQGWFVLCLGLGVCGLSNALLQPGMARQLATGLPPRLHPIGFGITLGAIPVSTLLGGLAVPVLATTAGWRWAFLAAAGSALGCALAAPGGTWSGAVPHGDDRRAARNTVRLAPLVVLALASTSAAAATSSLGTFVVAGAVHVGTSESAAGWIVAGSSFAAFAVRVTLGAFAGRWARPVLVWAGAMLVGGGASIAALMSDRRAVFVVAAPLAFVLAWGYAGLVNLAVVQLAPQAPGYATGLVMTGTYLGGVVGPPVFGLVYDHLSLERAWLVAGSWAGLAGVLMAWVGRATAASGRFARMPVAAGGHAGDGTAVS